MAVMKATPTDNDLFRISGIRKDRQRLRPAFMFEIKARQHSNYSRGYGKLVAVPPREAGSCPLAKHYPEAMP
jgi:hypothetical protein